jgi:hypothetical protein
MHRQEGREEWAEPKLPCTFRVLQLQRLEARMLWNGAGLSSTDQTQWECLWTGDGERSTYLSGTNPTSSAGVIFIAFATILKKVTSKELIRTSL